MMRLGLAALLVTLAEVAVALDGSSILGSPGHDATLGYTFRPSLGYELSNGAAGFVAVSYSRWGTNTGSEWQLAAQAGARFTYRRGRWLPWGEIAIGWGQLVFPQKRTDVGVRSSGALGLDFLAGEAVRAGVRLGLERIDGGGSPSYTTFWLDAGLAATFFLL
jgi:hypothetical protein